MQGWGVDAERKPTDGTKKLWKKRQRRNRRSKLMRCCSCGSGPGVVALHHALVYLVGWVLVCGVRLHYLPQVASCYDYEPSPQLPFCPSLPPRAEQNATARDDLLITFGAENETAIVTVEVSTEWVRSTPSLLDGGLTSKPGESKPMMHNFVISLRSSVELLTTEYRFGIAAVVQEFTCWLWFRLRLLHLPSIACLQELGGSWMAPLFAASCIGLYLVCLAWFVHILIAVSTERHSTAFLSCANDIKFWIRRLGDAFWIGPTVLVYLEGKEERALKIGQGRGVRAGYEIIRVSIATVDLSTSHSPLTSL